MPSAHAEPGSACVEGVDDELRRPDEVGGGDHLVLALGVDEHADAGDPLADLVDAASGEPAVHRAVARARASTFAARSCSGVTPPPGLCGS